MVLCAVAAAMLAGCAILPYDEPPERERAEPPAGEVPSLPVPGEPAPAPERSPRPMPLPAPEPEPEPLPPPSYHPAGEALLEQARREMLLDNDALAGATLERALRVDGNNPWIWIELGHLRLAAGQRPAAESLARKALSLANRDPGARDAAARLLQQAGGSR
jgi:tetratricopeptide (TPR) repeat protein